MIEDHHEKASTRCNLNSCWKKKRDPNLLGTHYPLIAQENTSG
jgi:hypothetical protein